MISVWPRSCDISDNSSLPKSCETGTQDVPEGKV